MESKTSNIGLSYGFIAGLLLIVFTLVLYLMGVEAFMSPISFLAYLIIIVLAILAGLKQRKNNGGWLKFSEALKITFTVFAVGFLLQTLFSYILFNFIDESFAAAVNQASLDKAEEMMRRFGAPDSEIDKAMESARGKNNFSLGNQLLGYGVMCIVFFIVSLIISAIIKKNQPEFDNSFNPQ